MVSNYLVKFLEEKEVPTVTKKRHTYLTYYGLEQQDTYVLKEGIVKTSIILRDGREFICVGSVDILILPINET